MKVFALQAIKSAGGIKLLASSTWRKKRLLILCYHGFSLRDEHQWWPGIYMTGQFFEQRLNLLKKKDYNVLALDEALLLLTQNDLPPRSVSITVDDGFYDFYSVAYPLLQKYKMHATVYVSTWYVQNYQRPVFNLMVPYLLWKGQKNNGTDTARLSKNGMALNAKDVLRIADKENWSHTDKDEALARIASIVGEDWTQLLQDRVLSFMNPKEIRQLNPGTVDIQMHTHRHRVSREFGLFAQEIEDNRNALCQCGIDQEKLIHFCYPSGEHYPELLPWLEQDNVRTATTCDPGIAQSDTNLLLLPRFLDSSNTTCVEFEAWTSGAGALLQRCTKAFT